MDITTHVKTYNDLWEMSYDKDDTNYSIQEILELLDLNHKKLSDVSIAAENKNWEKATAELLSYFKDKFAEQATDPMNTSDLKTSNDAIAHIITAKNFPPCFRGKDFDWKGKAVVDGKVIHGKEWMYQFHRLTWWEALSRTYGESKDEVYFNKWVYDMVSHYRAFPDLANAPWAVRRGMESFYRTKVYLYSIPYMIQSEQFNEKHLLFFLGTFHRTTEHLRTHYAKKGNHLVSELTQVLENAVQMPEFKKSKEWKAEAMERLPEQLFLCIHDDGMNREYVFSYHTFYIELFTDFYHIVKKHGLETEISERFPNILENMVQIFAEFTLPDFTVPQFGDAWKYRKFVDGVPESRYGYLFEKYHEDYPNNKLIQYFSQKFAGENPTEPAIKNAYYPESGFCAMRNGWNQDATVMAIKNTGGDDIWHNQPDSGTFLLYGHGRNFMNDSGCYMYASDDPKDQAWRDFFRKTENHQTLTLDGENTSSKPISTEFIEGERFVRLKTQNQSYDHLIHERSIWFIDQSFFVIYDRAMGSAQGEVKVHFQLNPAPVLMDTGKLQVSTQYRDNNNLVVTTYPTGGITPTLNTQEGHISYFINQKEPRTAWNLQIDKSDINEVSFLHSLILTKAPNAKPKTIFIDDKQLVVVFAQEVLKLDLR